MNVCDGAIGVRRGTCLALFGLSTWLASQTSHAAVVLFDAGKREMAGNADWLVDADAWNQNMPAYRCAGSSNEADPAPLPMLPQSGIASTTPETPWTGGLSAWAVELV